MPIPGAIFQERIDKMLGVFGRKFGVPCKVYRLQPGSAGDFPDGWTLLTSQAMVHKNRVRANDVDVAMTSERTLWYQVAGDMSQFLLGDVFVQNDAGYFPGVAYGVGATSVPGTVELNGFALAWHAMAQPPLAARLDRRVGIYRPTLEPINGQWRSQRETDMPLVLNNGVYSFGSSGGMASWVPAGFGTSDRQTRGEDMAPDPPGMLPVPRYYTYLPPLTGYTPAEGDAIITEDDARYAVIAPYIQGAGTVGSQLMTQRYISQRT